MREGKPFYVMIEEADGLISTKKGRLIEQTIHLKQGKIERTWDYSPKALKHYPTVWNKLGFSRGTYGMHHVRYDSRLPLILQNGQYQQMTNEDGTITKMPIYTLQYETPELAKRHKKNDAISSLSNSFKKTGQVDPLMKYMVFGGIGLVAFVIVAFLFAIYMITGGSLDIVGGK